MEVHQGFASVVELDVEALWLEVDPAGIGYFDIGIDFLIIVEGGNRFSTADGVFFFVFDEIDFKAEFAIEGDGVN